MDVSRSLREEIGIGFEAQFSLKGPPHIQRNSSVSMGYSLPQVEHKKLIVSLIVLSFSNHRLTMEAIT